MSTSQSHDVLQLSEMSILYHSISFVNHQELDPFDRPGERIVLIK